MTDGLAELNRNPLHSQLLADSHMGMALAALARKSETIVEIGTYNGAGSTYCLALGLERPSQRLVSVEMDEVTSKWARTLYDDPRIEFVHGTLVLPNEVPPFSFPDPSFRKYYDVEVKMNEASPYVLDRMPQKIDLLFLDGGEWSAGVEFAKLWERCQWIAMDDTNPKLVHKNVANREFLLAR